MNVPYYVCLLILPTIIIYEHMFTVQSQTNTGVWENVKRPQQLMARGTIIEVP